MKIKIFSFCLFLLISVSSVFAGDSINLPGKVSELFHRSFPEVKNVTWHKDEDSYQASFRNSDNNLCKICYSKTGKLLYTFKYYSGEELPLFIKTILAQQYNDTNILGVTEVYANSMTIYYLILGNKKWLYKVKLSENGEILDNETMVNGNPDN